AGTYGRGAWTLALTDEPLKVGDRVWNDLNENGLQDAGEPGVNGVTVALRDDTGQIIAATVTDGGSAGNGHYHFEDVEPGDYTITCGLRRGMKFRHHVTGDDERNSDVVEDGTREPFTVTGGADRLDIDAGLVSAPEYTGSVGDRVWFDTNWDGIQ